MKYNNLILAIEANGFQIVKQDRWLINSDTDNRTDVWIATKEDELVIFVPIQLSDKQLATLRKLIGQWLIENKNWLPNVTNVSIQSYNDFISAL